MMTRAAGLRASCIILSSCINMQCILGTEHENEHEQEQEQEQEHEQEQEVNIFV